MSRPDPPSLISPPAKGQEIQGLGRISRSLHIAECVADDAACSNWSAPASGPTRAATTVWQLCREQESYRYKRARHAQGPTEHRKLGLD
jgi:hypothetical protein